MIIVLVGRVCSTSIALCNNIIPHRNNFVGGMSDSQRRTGGLIFLPLPSRQKRKKFNEFYMNSFMASTDGKIFSGTEIVLDSNVGSNPFWISRFECVSTRPHQQCAPSCMQQGSELDGPNEGTIGRWTVDYQPCMGANLRRPRQHIETMKQ